MVILKFLQTAVSSLNDHLYIIAFVESTNITLYAWPIGCALYTKKIDVLVNGDNSFAGTNATSRPTTEPTPFARNTTDIDQLERCAR